VFGTDRIPNGWADRCNDLDELWLPSEFHHSIFAASGVERSKIRVIPQAIDSGIFHPARVPYRLPGVPTRSFHFLAVADGMLVSGIDVVLRAFIEEFAPHEDVALTLCCPPWQCGNNDMDVEAEVIAFIETKLDKNLEDVPSIALVIGALSEGDRASLFAASHAFVHPARAAATSHHCLEALACQLPVITTDWGPLNDFLTDRNSFRLAINGLVAAEPDEDERVAGHSWAEPNLDHLRSQMREVFTNRAEGKRRAAQGRREVVDRFEWGVVLPEWIRNFQRLLN
jgi:glycosyltransferase involved in cell wall biosynthesis